MKEKARRPLSYLLVAIAALVAGAILTGTLRMTPHAAASKRDTPVPASSQTIPSFADIAQPALTSVVSIVSTEVVRESGRSSSPFEFFFGPQPGTPGEHRQVQGGSGFVISEDGEILTNNHVVEGAQKIQVRLQDRQVLTAKVVGTDPATDIALIRVAPRGKLRPVPLGDSDKLRVGDWVMAIGNPMTFEGTVTVGVVSAKERSGLSEDANAGSLQDFIQTDAAINFGNSGGPLLNVGGQVVGIATMVVRPAQNIGFAVPINIARKILPQLEKKGKVTRGLVGVTVRTVDQDVQQAFHLPSLDGAFVESVDPDLPAGKAGLKPGDTIVKVDDMPVHTTRDLIDNVSSKAPGQTVRLTFLRDGRSTTANVTLTERRFESNPESRSSSLRGEGRDRGEGGKLGVAVTELTPEIRRELRIGPEVSGVVVEDVRNLSPAQDQGLATGDVITEVNGKPVRSEAMFRDEVNRAKKGEYLRLYVRRFVPQQIARYVLIPVEW
jgi:serine protease Do